MIVMAVFFTINAVIAGSILLFLLTPRGKRWRDGLNH